MQRKKLKQEKKYFWITTVTVFAEFVKKYELLLTQELKNLRNVVIVKKEKGASKCMKFVKSSCALVVMIISKLNFNYVLGFIIFMEFMGF